MIADRRTPIEPHEPRTSHGRSSPVGPLEPGHERHVVAEVRQRRADRRRRGPGGSSEADQATSRAGAGGIGDDPGVLAAAEHDERRRVSPAPDRGLARRSGWSPCGDDIRDASPRSTVGETGVVAATGPRRRVERSRSAAATAAGSAGTSMTLGPARRPACRSPTLTVGRSTAGASMSPLELLPSIASAIRMRPQ